MPASSWKDRLTDKQLAKKRLSDKLTQRRLRQQSRYAMTETERHINLLSSGQLGTLINCLLQDNATLRCKISDYQTSLESIVDEVKVCLESDYNEWNDMDSGNWFGTTPRNTRQAESSVSFNFSLPDSNDLAQMGIVVGGPESSRGSVFHQLYQHMGIARPDDSTIPVNELLESTMTWKSVRRYSDCGLQLLLDCTGLNQEPWNMTIENLLYGYEIPPSSVLSDQEPLQLSESQRLRRAAAVCAYERCRRWREWIKGSLEYAAVFWGDFTYFLLLVFPTAENYGRMPSWKNPTPSQFRSDHPDMIDFIIWPQLRTHLVTNWNKYDLADVYLKLAQNLQMQNCDTIDSGTAFVLAADLSDISLGLEFEKVVDDALNFGIRPCFDEYYPELAALIRETENTPRATPSNSTMCSQEPKRNFVPSANTARAKRKRSRRTSNISRRPKPQEPQNLKTRTNSFAQDDSLAVPNSPACAAFARVTGQGQFCSLPNEADHDQDMLWLMMENSPEDDSWAKLDLGTGLNIDSNVDSVVTSMP